MKGKSANVVEYLLEKGGICLPTTIFRNELLLELEKAISSGIPIRISDYYKKLADNLEEYISIDKTKEMIEIFLNSQKEFENSGKLTEDDLKIINFMVENTHVSAEDSIELSGSVYTLLKVYEDLKKEKIKSESLKMFIMISTFIQLYELILLQLDRRLRSYIKQNNLEKDFEKFLKRKREYTEHATAGEINNALSKLKVINSNNDSILSGRLKYLRNKFSHANFFYDSELDAVVVAGKERLTKKEFIGEFFRLFNFALTWFKLSAKVDDPSEALDVFKESLKKTCYELSRMFRSVERSHYKKWLGFLMIQWKRRQRNNRSETDRA